jgi:branched-chain amino acid transport system substrate-binding protein
MRTSNPVAESQMTKDRARRRRIIANAGLLIAGSWTKQVFSNPGAEPFRVAIISPNTGFLSAFGAPNVYVHNLLAQQLAAGVQTVHLGKRVIQLEMFDAASSTTIAAATATRLVASGIHLLIASGTPEICNPVSDVCEAAGVPCITTVAPWQAWLFGRKGDPTVGFCWTYHFFAGMEEFSNVYADLFKQAGLGNQVGGLFGDDLDAKAFLDVFPAAMARRSMSLFDPGRVKLSAPDFIPVARKLLAANIQIVTGNLPPSVALDFFSAAQKVGYKPRMASIAKAFIFPETVAKINQLGIALTNEVWWSPAWPFKSSFTGKTARQLCIDFETATKSPWVQPLGFSHALIDVVVEAVRQARAPTREGLREAISRLSVSTVIGVISFKSRYPSLNVCTTPAVGGQWQQSSNGQWTLEVIDNTRSPFIPNTSKLTL